MYVITKWCKCITDSRKDEYTHKKHDNMPYEFRLLDDDYEIYAYGYASSCDDNKAFDPLDNYRYVYGCTMIEYKNAKTGNWEML